MSIESVMPSNHLILCRPLLRLPSVFPRSGSFPMSQFFTLWTYTLLNEKALLCVSFSLIPLRSLLFDPHTAKDFEKLLFTYLSIPVPEPVSHCLVSWFNLYLSALSIFFVNNRQNKKQTFFFWRYDEAMPWLWFLHRASIHCQSDFSAWIDGRIPSVSKTV